MDLNQGFLATQKPSKPIKHETPKAIACYPGTDYDKYISFLQTVNNLSMMFKFISPTGMNKDALNTSYKNLKLDPLANDWVMIEDQMDSITTDDASILDQINDHFGGQWEDIKAAGGGMSYSQLAGMDLSSYTPEQAFNLMCSVLESKERIFLGFQDMFGTADAGDPDNNQAVINSFTAFLESYMIEEGKFGLDTHNICVLSIFFDIGTNTDFINEIDAYMNYDTYWGVDSALMSKVDSYIAGLSGDTQEAAGELKTMWLTHMPKWNEVNGTNVDDLKATEGSWVNFFAGKNGKMAEFNNERTIRLLIAHMMDRSAEKKFKTEMKDYEGAKEEKSDEDRYLMRMEAKKKAQNSKFRKRASSAKRSKMSKAIKAKRSKSSISSRATPRVSMANKYAANATKVTKVRPQAAPQRVSAPKVTAKSQSSQKKDRRVI